MLQDDLASQISELKQSLASAEAKSVQFEAVICPSPQETEKKTSYFFQDKASVQQQLDTVSQELVASQSEIKYVTLWYRS